MSTLVLDVDELVAGHSGVPVIHHLDFSLRSGEVTALLGANGAGKTTTLDTIAGAVAADAGSVRLLGADVTDMAPHRRARAGLGYVPEDRGLFGPLTVRENLRLAARGSRRRRAAAIDTAIDRFPDLAHHLNREASLLSGGQQQMLAMARALVPEPKLLLIDEMSLGLAPLVVESLLPMVREVADSGAAVLLVEQHVGVALSVADHAMVLASGEITLQGSADDIAAEADALTDAYLG